MSTVIRDLWPDDIKSDDVISPEEILKHQAQRLEARTNGLLVGHIEKTYGDDRITLGFEVDAPLTSKRVRLFEAQHREEYEYPVALNPPDKEVLPEFLRDRVYQASVYEPLGATLSAVSKAVAAQGHWVKNEWVATSPDEFSTKVEEILARADVKAIVLSLLARARQEESTQNSRETDPS